MSLIREIIDYVLDDFLFEMKTDENLKLIKEKINKYVVSNYFLNDDSFLDYDLEIENGFVRINPKNVLTICIFAGYDYDKLDIPKEEFGNTKFENEKVFIDINNNIIHVKDDCDKLKIDGVVVLVDKTGTFEDCLNIYDNLPDFLKKDVNFRFVDGSTFSIDEIRGLNERF